jgi:hypothetical protein
VSTAYPPEPWRLRGDLHMSVFLVPLAEVPLDLPPRCRPIRLGRFGVVTTAWVIYRPGGVLAYDELMSMVLVRDRWRPRPTITHIWVDSIVSRDGGRALWGIPKELATFERSADRFAAASAEAPIATGTVRPRLRVPGRVPSRFHVVQTLAGAAKVTAVRARARLALSRAEFDVDATGPLGFLAGHRPVVSLSFLDFRLTFGRR